MKIEHCPTKDMVADFFTKPLQGSQFTKMRDKIMNVNPRCLDYSTEDCRSVLNIATVSGKQTVGTGTQNNWITVESKGDKRQAKRTMKKQNKRIESRLNHVKTRSVDGNVKAKGEPMRFKKE